MIDRARETQHHVVLNQRKGCSLSGGGGEGMLITYFSSAGFCIRAATTLLTYNEESFGRQASDWYAASA